MVTLSRIPTSWYEIKGSTLRFGLFVAPFHPTDGNPTLQMRRDIELAVLVDELGYDEIWFGEHHSGGFESSGSPEIMIAAAGERTARIRLGTGVNSVSYHNPLILADRIVQLDHLTRGRVIMGIGPGQLPSDAYMLGIDPAKQRDMMHEAIDAIAALLRGETVTKSTDWFTLREARLQLAPLNPEGIEIGIASVYSPTGVTLAGRYGLSVLSIAAADSKAASKLRDNWAIHEKVSAEHGTLARRDRWRVVGSMHLAETREQARREVEVGILRNTRYFEMMSGNAIPWRASAEQAVAHWTSDGMPSWGVGVIGTPEDAIARIHHVLDITGGFGTFLLNVHDCASWAATRRSYELFAEYVIPHFTGANAPRVASLEWARQHAPEFSAQMSAAIDKASQQYAPPA